MVSKVVHFSDAAGCDQEEDMDIPFLCLLMSETGRPVKVIYAGASELKSTASWGNSPYCRLPNQTTNRSVSAVAL